VIRRISSGRSRLSFPDARQANELFAAATRAPSRPGIGVRRGARVQSATTSAPSTGTSPPVSATRTEGLPGRARADRHAAARRLGFPRLRDAVKFKRDLLAEVAGMLAFLAVRTNDKVGASSAAGRREVHPAKKGRARLAVDQGVFTYQPRHPGPIWTRRLIPEPGGEAARDRVPDLRLPGRGLKVAAPDREEARAVVIRISDPAEDELPTSAGHAADRRPARSRC